jgi:hypothetical protein
VAALNPQKFHRISLVKNLFKNLNQCEAFVPLFLLSLAIPTISMAATANGECNINSRNPRLVFYDTH